jgi:hypothetical protein
MNPTSLLLYGFVVEFEAVQFPFSRFSKEAKKEFVWIDRLESQFQRDFSWRRLRQLYSEGKTS